MTGRPQSRRSFRLFSTAVVAWARFDYFVQRAMRSLAAAADGAFATALTTPEMDALTVRLYDHQRQTYAPDSGLSDWEKEWFASALPAAPAPILVAAAGAGREVAGLVEQGYDVDAFEPAATLATVCAGVSGAGLVVTAAFDDFVRAVLDDDGTPASGIARRRYDAVILGWGSLHHVLEQRDRLRLLRAAARLSPRGPLLASFHTSRMWAADRDSRGRTLGRHLGERVRRGRGLGPLPDDVHFRWRIGFVHPLDRSEVEDLGDDIGRVVTYADEPYGHATFLPDDKAIDAPASNRNEADASEA